MDVSIYCVSEGHVHHKKPKISHRVLFLTSRRSGSTANRNGDYNYAEDIRPYFNFGVADIDINGNLEFSIINTDNEVCSVHDVIITVLNIMTGGRGVVGGGACVQSECYHLGD